MAEMHSRQWFDEAFAPVANDPKHMVPPVLRALSEMFCCRFGIRGVSDPMYVANVSAVEFGMGNGLSTFTRQDIHQADPQEIKALAKRLCHSYSSHFPAGLAEGNTRVIECIEVVVAGSLTQPTDFTPPEAPKVAWSYQLPPGLDRLDRSALNKAITKVMEYSHTRGVDINTLIALEPYPKLTQGTFALQFTTGPDQRPSGNLHWTNLATYIVDLKDLNFHPDGGRKYWVTSGVRIEDASPLFAQALVQKFAQSPLLGAHELEFNPDPECGEPSLLELRVVLVNRLIAELGVRRAFDVLEVGIQSDESIDSSAAVANIPGH